MVLRRDTAKDAALLVLRHENAVLRRQIAGPVRYEPEDRFWLAALSRLIPLKGVFTAATVAELRLCERAASGHDR
ncbi:hypothetical protein P3T36_006259 [Kitasatospora sp. MAP12-15]|uniref:hypothetical protein n=1 Tax=unclassified Kitasatospora TaxID=2633591 RepID=UPI00247C5C40|nr:hypothetical protein [Kitasatospora sp. MAP12-44]